MFFFVFRSFGHLVFIYLVLWIWSTVPAQVETLSISSRQFWFYMRRRACHRMAVQLALSSIISVTDGIHNPIRDSKEQHLRIKL